MDRDHTGREQRLAEQLDELRAAYDDALRAPRRVGAARGDSFFLFEVAGSVMALPAVELSEALPARGVVRAPGGGGRLAGAVTYRQEIVQVLDLRTVLGIGGDRPSAPAWVLVLRPLQRRTGFLADALMGLVQVAAGTIDPLDEPFRTGHFVRGGRPVTVVSTERILAKRESGTEEGR